MPIRSIPRRVKSLLRSPKVILGEILAIAGLCALGAAVPQVGTATSSELARLQQFGPLLQGVIRVMSLDHIFRSAWFLAPVLLAAASLSVVLIEQLRRLQAQWGQGLRLAHFDNAPFRAEFERPARLDPRGGIGQPQAELRTERRLGLGGSPLFHLGLFLVIVAALLRVLFGADAVADLMEGETLPAGAAGFAGQWPGLLAPPVSVNAPVILKSVRANRYTTGDLRELGVRLEVQEESGSREVGMAVNHDLRLAGTRLFLASDFGPAALVHWRQGGKDSKREAALLTEQRQGTFEGTSVASDGSCAYLRMSVDPGGSPSPVVEVRVMKDNALRFVGHTRVGETVSVPGGLTFTVEGTPLWVRMRASRDPALWLAYLGFALLIAGATILFMIIKLDVCRVITPLGDRERVFVALKPQRFAPLFEERFQRLVEQEGGQPSPRGQTPVKDEARDRARPPVEPAALPLRSGLAGRVFLLLCATFLTSCGKSPVEQARALVERYNQVVSEAYRRGDVKLIDPVVGPREGKKLTGLIGVRLDLGLTLDSHLLSLEVTAVERSKDLMRVSTRERWRYRDLRIGSGKQVGEESMDSYEMLYIFTNSNNAWLVDEIRFTQPPQVGRTQTAWLADRKPAPAAATSTAPPEGKQP
jgi:hypothetical protein